MFRKSLDGGANLLILILSGLLLIPDISEPRGEGLRGDGTVVPTLARLSFWVPPQRMAEFASAYEARIAPILKRHDLVASSERGRATPDSIFSRLVEVNTPSEVEGQARSLQGDEAWTAVLRNLGGVFGAGQGGLIRHHLSIYVAPGGSGKVTTAGPGKVVPAGPGTGHWKTYDVTDGLAGGIVWSILQDKGGYLWFGTEGGGVSRFDGQHFTTFTTKDGLASNSVLSMFQDRDGYLWIGTNEGLSRYDPMGRSSLRKTQGSDMAFTTFTTRDGLAGNRVESIFQDRDGYLWFGTRWGGVSRYDGKVFTTLNSNDGLAGNQVWAISQDREGHLWFCTYDGVSQYDGKTFTTLTVKDGLPDNQVRTVVEDRDGYLWLSTARGVSRYGPPTSGQSQGSGQSRKALLTFTSKDGLADDDVWAALRDQDGYIWFGTTAGVSRYDPSTPGFALRSELALRETKGQAPSAQLRAGGKSFVTLKDGMDDNRVRSIFQDREGHFWFGTGGGGVSRYDDKTFTTFASKDGLADNEVRSVIQDREGNLWLGTRGGVCRYDGKAFTTFTSKDGLADNEVRSVIQDREGNLWLGTKGGVSRYDGKTFTTFTSKDGLADNEVRPVFQDREGYFWLGTRGGLSRYDGQSFTTFSTQDGLADDDVRTIFQDQEGHLWFGTPTGVSRYDPVTPPRVAGSQFTTFTTRNGLVDNWVTSIAQDRKGVLWFGTRGGGVCRYDGRSFTTPVAQDGLPDNQVLAVFRDMKDHLWFGTRGGGVSQFDGQAWTTLTKRDGVANNQVYSLIEDRSEQFWFGTGNGLTRYSRPAPLPPLPFIDAVVADRRYSGISNLSIPSNQDLIVFEYNAMSFKTRPEAMVYRYRLNGYDKDWKTTHARRVEYHSLPRGNYRFEILAVDRDLVYSERPAAVELRVHPPYTQIGLVAALCIAGVLIVWQVGRVFQRDRKLGRSNEDLRREMAERKRFEEERAKLDVQLQEMRYLYRLRSVLSTARSPEAVVQSTGEVMLETLPTSALAGILIEHDGRVWPFGACHTCEFHRATPALSLRGQWTPSGQGDDTLSSRQRAEALLLATCRDGRGGDSPPNSGRPHYGIPLVWGERVRGCLHLCCDMALSESQERALLDETAAQVTRVLESREFEVQLLQSARLVSLGQMAAGVAHEINQPLGAISATAEDYYLRLKEGMVVSPEQWGEALKRVLGMVERMSGTVEHLRVFSRDTSQEPGIRLSMNQVIHSALSVMGTQLKNHGIDLRLDLAEDLPQVMGHPYQVEQVFLNLLGNARDAVDEKTGYREPGTVDREGQTSDEVGGMERSTDDGTRTTDHESRGWEKRVWVRTRLEGDWVVVEVEDNGVGIDVPHLGRVFEPFFTTKPADRGTGLGLSISYAIVKNHGGQITCESRKGEGATFRVMLPAGET